VIAAGKESARGMAYGSLTGRLTEVAEGYQQALLRNPHDARALTGMCLVALASRQVNAAVRMAEAAVTADSALVTAWVALGQALSADGQTCRAEEAYAAALRLDRNSALARLGLGELKIAAGRSEEALDEFAQLLERDPPQTAGCLGMGHALSCLGRFAEALEFYERAKVSRPKLAEAEFAAGFALQRLGRVPEAEKRYRRAIALRPDFAAAWMNLGCLLRELGRDVYAEAALRRAVELRPDLIAGWVNLALLERERGRLDQAEAHLQHALKLDPEQVDTHVAWAQFCAGRKDFAGAWGWVRWAVARDEENGEAWNMMGILLHTDLRFDEAVTAFARAEELGSLPATSNRGNSLLDLGRVNEALEAHETAVERDPNHAGAKYNLALTRLRLGDWARGWADYEARWGFREVHRRPRKFDCPRWAGEALKGQRVLLHAEQGLGDTIQFCRYAELVAERGGRPILQVQAPVERLMRSLEVVCTGGAEVAVLGAKTPEAGLECPLMSLAAVFGTTVETVPWRGPYLTAAPDEVEAKRLSLGDCGDGGLRVGIAWAGNPKYKADMQRSMRLETLLPLLRAPGATWISLQKGEPAAQIAALPPDVRVVDGSSGDCDLAETAALLAGLDLVITTDTCVAHLAGAMGKPVWILLPHLGDWRWMQDRETTPWYPTVTLVRQCQPGDWSGVLRCVVAMLKAFRR